MVFSGIPFMIFFLPPLLCIYFLLPEKWIKGKNVLLLLFSLLFYSIGEPRYIILMLLSITSAYFFALAIDKVSRGRGLLLAASIVLALLPLLYYKYVGFFVETINGVLQTSLAVPKLSLPIGISFYTFQLISYLADVYRKRTEAQKDPLALALYVSFFPQLIAGPIVRYTDVNAALKERTHTLDGFYSGAWRFTVGVAKKVLIANTLGELCEVYRSAETTMLFTWIYGIAICCQIYFDFSGYSDMAIGLGRIFGFSFPENFRYPFMSGGVAEFWRRWHMTLGSWFRDYIYIPMGGNRVSFLRWIGNIATVWFLTGFWHGAGWTFICWGLYFAVFLVLEKQLSGILQKIPTVLRHIGTVLVIMVSFILFDAVDIPSFGRTLLSLVDVRNLWDNVTLYYLRSYGLLLVLACVGATDLPARFGRWLSEKSRIKGAVQIATPIVMVVLLVVSLAYLVDGSFNPFLYFRF